MEENKKVRREALMNESKMLSWVLITEVFDISALSAKKKILFFTNSSLMITNGQFQLGKTPFFQSFLSEDWWHSSFPVPTPSTKI